METISVRYGETETITIQADEPSAVSASLYVGIPGQPYKFVVTTPIVGGEGVFEISEDDTKLPLSSTLTEDYRYQVNVIHSDGAIDKYPEPNDCYDCDEDETELPLFTVHEALDLTEVVS